MSMRHGKIFIMGGGRDRELLLTNEQSEKFIDLVLKNVSRAAINKFLGIKPTDRLLVTGWTYKAKE